MFGFFDKFKNLVKESEPLIGSVWINELDANPFQNDPDIKVPRITVIAVADGWVKYRRSGGHVDTCKLDVFNRVYVPL